MFKLNPAHPSVAAKVKAAQKAASPRAAGAAMPRFSTRPASSCVKRSRLVNQSMLSSCKLNMEFLTLPSETATAAELARNEALSDPEVTRSALESMTAKQKFDAAVKQMRRKLEVEIRKELHAEYHKWVQRQLDQYNENAKHYEIIIKARKGLMDKTAYNLIWSCLHADSRKSVSDERLNRAFNLWASLEKAILSEKDKPTTPSSLPKTVDELLKRREAYQAQRAAERAKKSKTGNAMAR